MNNTPLWVNKPQVLLDKNQILQLWPLQSFSYNEKNNAIVRIILILCLLGYLTTKSFTIVAISFIALLIMVYLSSKRQSSDYINGNEGFTLKEQEDEVVEEDENENENDKVSSSVNNPLNNLLLSDIHNKAKNSQNNHPSYSDITNNINLQIENNKNNQKDNLWDRLNNDHSNRAFYTTPNNNVMNDQEGFANFLFGDLKSSKDNGNHGVEMRLKHSERYYDL